MYFACFQNFSIKVPAKFEKYRNLLGIFGSQISKCQDLIEKNIPLPAHSLYSSLSMKLKLYFNHYESPCIYILRFHILFLLTPLTVTTQLQITNFLVKSHTFCPVQKFGSKLTRFLDIFWVNIPDVQHFWVEFGLFWTLLEHFLTEFISK